MGIKKINRAVLIDTAGYFFRTQGFHGTSVQVIADRLNVNKASLYHHVIDKEMLALTALEAHHRFFQHHFFSLAYDSLLIPRDRLSRFAEALETHFMNTEGGCLIANLTLELGNQFPTFSAVMQAYFSDWANAFGHLFEAQYPTDIAREKATQAVARFQGALIAHRLGHASALMKQKEHLLATFDGLQLPLLSSTPKTVSEDEGKAQPFQPRPIQQGIISERVSV